MGTSPGTNTMSIGDYFPSGLRGDSMRAYFASFSIVLRVGLTVCLLLALAATSAAKEGEKPSAGIGQRAGSKTDGADDESHLVGDWKGESIVVAKNTAAKDEVVVWHISKARGPGKLNVRADKIVNGKSITMGTLAFEYDKTQKTIVCKYKQGVWRLTVDADTLKGTLTLPDQTVLRQVSLEKSSPSKPPQD